ANPPTLEDFAPDDFTWSPQPLARAVTGRRNFRWTVVVLALLVGLAGAIGVMAAASLPATAADERVDAFDDLATRIESSLATFEATLVDGEALAPAAVRLQGLADELVELSTLPDPRLAVIDTGHDLDGIHAAGFEVAAVVGRLASTTLGIADYVAAVDGLIVLPDLPARAQGPDIAELDARLATALAEAGSRVAGLPEVEELQAHRQAAVEALAWFAGWRETYLNALRDDSGNAEWLAAEAARRLADLDTVLVAERERAAGIQRDLVDFAQLRVRELKILTG
ncbi:MAG: hypothetical protein R3290_06840, partial [Acidimicrobiia bacterium]|nr:hypothetical protein [Acidimicrobiia bacterium]